MKPCVRQQNLPEAPPWAPGNQEPAFRLWIHLSWTFLRAESRDMRSHATCGLSCLASCVGRDVLEEQPRGATRHGFVPFMAV